jgi:uncharacterized membrane protein YagU involved in acid resistance
VKLTTIFQHRTIFYAVVRHFQGLIGGMFSAIGATGYIASMVSRKKQDLVRQDTKVSWPSQDCSDAGALSLQILILVTYLAGSFIYVILHLISLPIRASP